MSLWGQMTQQQGQELAYLLSAARPFVGRTVRIDRGRKHVGVVGLVTWHGTDNFSTAGRYGDAFVQAAREVRGRYGFRIRVQPADGTAPFFVSADNVMVAVEAAQ